MIGLIAVFLAGSGIGIFGFRFLARRSAISMFGPHPIVSRDEIMEIIKRAERNVPWYLAVIPGLAFGALCAICYAKFVVLGNP